MQRSLELGVVGNCTWGGLVDERARLVWACFPRFDSDPFFPALLDEREHGAGSFAIELLDLASSEQRYEGNTPILVTTLRDRAGSEVEVRDFAPRFQQHGRFYRPTMLVRRVRPLRGDPRIRIVLEPRCDHGRERPVRTRGSNHLRFVAPEVTLRLTTNAPISFVADGTPFLLERPLDLILGPDESLTASIESTARDFQERTYEYWSEWSRTLSIPFEWQEAVIRAAITLKLCNFEDTGAIVAALTTSIPEFAGSERNWDYRYCWLRDSYFVVHALNRLGATKTMEGYLHWIANLVAAADGRLQPVYGVGLESRLEERIATSLAGYRGMGPVRIGNQAYEQPQHDIYGSIVLASTQSFFDRRLLHPGGLRLFELLERVGEQALRLWDRPDAGPWELRTKNHVHTFSAVMCWAACDRLAKIATQLDELDRAVEWRTEADRLRAAILERAWCERRGRFAATLGGDELDATLLLLPELGFVRPDDPRFTATLAAVERELRRGPYLFRYAVPDDFGVPHTAFNICTFWYIDALAAVGRRDEARELFENMLARRSRLGLLSEDLDPKTGELWGNFPQTYSMVGLINAAMRLSRPWEDAL
ncbi:MAG TPA: glycoside hydrolase family 15 protein [Myxococcota bacterium]|nr:glycoside hydrolase family 15 protein [Myxococcota bacterium]